MYECNAHQKTKRNKKGRVSGQPCLTDFVMKKGFPITTTQNTLLATIVYIDEIP
jgi:hypothetical protein